MIVTINDIPVFRATISDEDEGMMRISLVDDPAVMSDFQAFDKNRKPLLYSVQNEEKRLVRGVVMRADFPIYRYDDVRGEFYIIYKADTIRQMAEKYLAENRQNLVNIMHQDNSDVEGVQMVQYFIKDTAAGLSPEGFEEIADGSLFAEFHVDNDDIWDAIKEGTFKGFSLEGYFDLEPEQDVIGTAAIVDTLKGAFARLIPNFKNMSKLSKIKAALAAALQEFGNITTDRGVISWDGFEDLKAGDAVFIEDQNGELSPAADGEYKTDDGKVITIADGKVSEIKDAEAEVAPAGEAAPEFAAVPTDKGDLLWDGEGELAEGLEVFVEKDGEKVPAEDGEYKTEDGKTIVVADGKISEIKDAEPAGDAENEALRAENESLRAENAELREKVSQLEKMSAAKPAHAEVQTSGEIKLTGNKGIDRLARIMAAK